MTSPTPESTRKPTPEDPKCGHCGGALESLGGTKTNFGAGPVEIVHYVCSSCQRRWLHHSIKGWKPTDRDLSN